MDGMPLGELIAWLKARNPSDVARPGFKSPHSYRGYYECLAFEPVESATAGEMLAAASEANGSTYHGHKGGQYHMDEYTPCFLAERGHTGEPLSRLALRGMFAPPEATDAR